MTIDKNFIDKFVNITSKAALASSYLVGKKDKIAADKAAVDSMRSELNKLEMKGQIVIGEGELERSASAAPQGPRGPSRSRCSPAPCQTTRVRQPAASASPSK